MQIDVLQKLNENERQAFISRYSQAQVYLGEDVGVIASQSIGQPTTQIALSSFHSASTTAIEVLEGIPRLESILNCSFKQSISTIHTTRNTSPSYFVYLTIPDIMSSYYIKSDLDSWWYAIVEKHDFYTTPTSYNKGVVFRMIVDSKKMKAYKVSLKLIRDRIVEPMYGNNIIRVLISPEFEHTIDKAVQHAAKSSDVEMYVYGLVKSIIFPIQICGVKGIEHILINNNEVKTKGSNLMSTLGLDFVDSKLTISDSAVDVLKCLEIEAARNVLVRELSKVLKGDVCFNDKYINLLTNFMTNKGKMVLVNISEIVERGHSYFTRASNERTIVELARAACKGVAKPV
uniref:DNA-directed RNA polymerase n=2 Tax=Physcomitrium patens TaxID=3218 RepID=A0A7I4DR62_PHYPA